MVREHEYAEALRSEAAVKYCKLWFPLNPNFGVTEKQTYRKETIMPTVKTVEVNFTFAYVDKRRKYTSKDFGLKSIPYGEGDETEADGLPAYQEELEYIQNVLRDVISKINSKSRNTHVNKPSLSNEWISLYNFDNKHNKLDIEIEIAVSTTLEIQLNNLSNNEHNVDGIIYNKVMMILNDLEELSYGRATSRSYSYE